MIKTAKRIIAAILTIAVCIGLSGCITVNAQRDLARPIANVFGKDILKSEIIAMYLGYEDYYKSMYAQFGMELNDELAYDLKVSMAEMKIKDTIIKHKVEEGGFNNLTEEELAEVNKEFEEYLENERKALREQHKDSLPEDPEKAKEYIETQLDLQFAYNGYSREMYLEDIKNAKAQEKLRESVTSHLTVSDAEAEELYGLMLTEQRIKYDKPEGETIPEETSVKLEEAGVSASSFTSDIQQNGFPVVYYPKERFVRVKQVLIKAVDFDTKKSEIEDNEELSDEQKKTQIEALENEIFGKIREEAETVLQKAKSGEDFNSLIEQYNDDPGITKDSKGYVLGESTTYYVEEFKRAALALQKVGDISGLVKTDNGYHIIRLEEVYPQGVTVGFAEVKDKIMALALKKKKDAFWNEQIKTWEKEGNLKTWFDRLK